MTEPTDLESRCDMLRSLHVSGTPVVLPNAWDVASARAVVAAGFPVVATTSGGVAASLGYEDHERAPLGSPQVSTSRLPSTPRPAMGWNPPISWPG
jgi:2-methylisocitrate lyase-like PEP mutase family enzyme